MHENSLSYRDILFHNHPLPSQGTQIQTLPHSPWIPTDIKLEKYELRVFTTFLYMLDWPQPFATRAFPARELNLN